MDVWVAKKTLKDRTEALDGLAVVQTYPSSPRNTMLPGDVPKPMELQTIDQPHSSSLTNMPASPNSLHSRGYKSSTLQRTNITHISSVDNSDKLSGSSISVTARAGQQAAPTDGRADSVSAVSSCLPSYTQSSNGFSKHMYESVPCEQMHDYGPFVGAQASCRMACQNAEDLLEYQAYTEPYALHAHRPSYAQASCPRPQQQYMPLAGARAEPPPSQCVDELFSGIQAIPVRTSNAGVTNGPPIAYPSPFAHMQVAARNAALAASSMSDLSPSKVHKVQNSPRASLTQINSLPLPASNSAAPCATQPSPVSSHCSQDAHVIEVLKPSYSEPILQSFPSPAYVLSHPAGQQPQVAGSKRPLQGQPQNTSLQPNNLLAVGIRHPPLSTGSGLLSHCDTFSSHKPPHTCSSEQRQSASRTYSRPLATAANAHSFQGGDHHKPIGGCQVSSPTGSYDGDRMHFEDQVLDDAGAFHTGSERDNVQLQVPGVRSPDLLEVDDMPGQGKPRLHTCGPMVPYSYAAGSRHILSAQHRSFVRHPYGQPAVQGKRPHTFHGHRLSRTTVPHPEDSFSHPAYFQHHTHDSYESHTRQGRQTYGAPPVGVLLDQRTDMSYAPPPASAYTDLVNLQPGVANTREIQRCTHSGSMTDLHGGQAPMSPNLMPYKVGLQPGARQWALPQQQLQPPRSASCPQVPHGGSDFAARAGTVANTDSPMEVADTRTFALLKRRARLEDGHVVAKEMFDNFSNDPFALPLPKSVAGSLSKDLQRLSYLTAMKLEQQRSRNQAFAAQGPELQTAQYGNLIHEQVMHQSLCQPMPCNTGIGHYSLFASVSSAYSTLETSGFPVPQATSPQDFGHKDTLCAPTTVDFECCSGKATGTISPQVAACTPTASLGEQVNLSAAASSLATRSNDIVTTVVGSHSSKDHLHADGRDEKSVTVMPTENSSSAAELMPLVNSTLQPAGGGEARELGLNDKVQAPDTSTGGKLAADNTVMHDFIGQVLTSDAFGSQDLLEALLQLEHRVQSTSGDSTDLSLQNVAHTGEHNRVINSQADKLVDVHKLDPAPVLHNARDACDDDDFLDVGAFLNDPLGFQE